jgi:hypothetical protein
MDNDNPWCSIATDLFGTLGDMQMKYEVDWPELAKEEYAASEAGLKEHIQNCAQCSIAEAGVRGPIYSC